MKIKSPQLRAAPQLMFRIAIVLAVVAALSMLVDPRSSQAPGTAPSWPWSGIAAWAEPAPALAPAATSGVRARGRCAECGVIEWSSDADRRSEVSDGSAESAAPVSSERTIAVRLADGSTRVIGDPMPAHWRVRERVIVIGGLTAGR